MARMAGGPRPRPVDVWGGGLTAGVGLVQAPHRDAHRRRSMPRTRAVCRPHRELDYGPGTPPILRRSLVPYTGQAALQIHAAPAPIPIPASVPAPAPRPPECSPVRKQNQTENPSGDTGCPRARVPRGRIAGRHSASPERPQCDQQGGLQSAVPPARLRSPGKKLNTPPPWLSGKPIRQHARQGIWPGVASR